MNGVEVVSQEIVYKTTTSLLPFFIAIVVFAVIGFIEWGRKTGGFNVVAGMVGAYLGTVIGLFIGALISGVIVQPTNEIDYIKYTVIVNDSVLMDEFMDKYQVLEQEGRVYTVIEKE